MIFALLIFNLPLLYGLKVGQFKKISISCWKDQVTSLAPTNFSLRESEEFIRWVKSESSVLKVFLDESDLFNTEKQKHVPVLFGRRHDGLHSTQQDVRHCRHKKLWSQCGR